MFIDTFCKILIIVNNFYQSFIHIYIQMLSLHI